jgi:uncharacterized protein YaeQ
MVPAEGGDALMALTATIYNVEIDLADADRGVYESLVLRVARHPSESEAYLVTRLLAYALEYTEGIEFAPGGLSDPDQPAILVKDLTGRVRTWIEVGAPDPARVHRASKAADRVAIYIGRNVRQLLEQFAGQKVHRAEAIELYEIDKALIDALSERPDRRLSFALSVNDRELFVSIGAETFAGHVTRHPLPV